MKNIIDHIEAQVDKELDKNDFNTSISKEKIISIVEDISILMKYKSKDKLGVHLLPDNCVKVLIKNTKSGFLYMVSLSMENFSLRDTEAVYSIFKDKFLLESAIVNVYKLNKIIQ